MECIINDGEKSMTEKSNCWLLYGEDPVCIETKKETLIRTYFKAGTPEMTVCDHEESYGALMEQIRGQSLFSPTASAVVIRNPRFRTESAKDKEGFRRFTEAMKEAPDTVLIILIIEGKPDRRLKSVKTLLEICRSEEASFLKAPEAVRYMESIFRRNGYRMDAGARTYLSRVLETWTTISGPFLDTECEKILLMAGETREIPKDLMEKALPSYMDQGVFRFFDHLIGGDAEAVLADADHVFTDMETTLLNIGFLASKFRKIRMFLEMRAARVPEDQIRSELGIRGSWQWNELVRQAGMVTAEEADMFLVSVFRCQYRIRQNVTDPDAWKDMLVRFCMRRKNR